MDHALQEHAEMCSNGHLLDCEALEPAWDLGDLWGKDCQGCCPHGEKPHGIVAEQSAVANNFRAFVTSHTSRRKKGE